MTHAVERAKVGRLYFTIVEMDLPRCTRTYGTAPCTAQLGTTGTVKCYQSRATCQDPANFASAPQTYRFCSVGKTIPQGLSAVPCVKDVNITPTRLQVGKGVGDRAKVVVQLQDFLSNDRGIDPYVNERTYDPLEQGTFFGRLIARHPYYLGRALRVMTGYLTENAVGSLVYDAANFVTRAYFLEKIDGPSSDGQVTITAKDILKFASNERAVCPRPSQGRLFADINAAATSAALTPTDIGDADYATEGYIRVNSEVMSFTRIGDALTLTRAQFGTTAADHNADDLVQQCKRFEPATMDIHLADLLVNFAGVDAAYIPTADWAAETTTYLPRNYSTLVTEPTGVLQLVDELLTVGPAYQWWDERESELIFRALRPASSATLELDDDDNFLADSVAIEERLDLRVSQSFLAFGLKNFAEFREQTTSYRVAVLQEGDGSTDDKYGQEVVRQVYTRWLPDTARTFADQVAAATIQRYNEAPHAFRFKLAPKDGDLWTGDLFKARTHVGQDADGSQKQTTYQVLEVSENRDDDTLQYLALEERYSTSGGAARTITLSAQEYLDKDLREIHDDNYAAPIGPVDVTFTIVSGTIMGATRNAATFGPGGNTTPPGPALRVGDWPAGSNITINLLGRIEGAAGQGGSGYHTGAGSFASGQVGGPGGVALYTRFPVTVNCASGTPQIWGGGGGGGGGGSHNGDAGGGGGGQGDQPGDGGYNGATFGGSSTGSAPDGTTETHGAGAAGTGNAAGGGAGGDAGQPGAAGSSIDQGAWPGQGLGGAGGAAGAAIDGVSFVTFVGSADIRGSQI